MAEATKGSSSGSLAWWLGGVVIVGLGFAVHRMLDFDADFDLDWENLPA